MGQKTSPIGFRTGITLGWQSTWFAPKANYGDFLVEDQKIRKYIDNRFNRQMPKGAVAKVEIIRTRNEVNVTLHSGRPGVVIGPRGGEVDKLREELEGVTGRKVTVNVIEIKEPDLNAALVGEGMAEQLAKRASFRRTMKQFCEAAMNAGRQGRQDHLRRTVGRFGNGPHGNAEDGEHSAAHARRRCGLRPGDRPYDVRGDRHQGVDLSRQVRRSAGAQRAQAAAAAADAGRTGWPGPRHCATPETPEHRAPGRAVPSRAGRPRHRKWKVSPERTALKD